MLKVENVEVLGWEHAIRGMRNPKNSWAKSDSGPECPYGKEKCCGECQQNFCIGPNDKQLVTDESIRDTLLDLANYAIMTVLEMDAPDESHATLYAYDKPIYTVGEDKQDES